MNQHLTFSPLQTGNPLFLPLISRQERRESPHVHIHFVIGKYFLPTIWIIQLKTILFLTIFSIHQEQS